MAYKNPYQALPAYTRWSKSVAGVEMDKLDPVVDFPFKISSTDKVATAGSCFAQHIARHLSQNGFNYFVTEKANPIFLTVPELDKKYNYGTFSARYGNLYTSRQLVQTFKRAFGKFTPLENYWFENGCYIDPFRPVIQPNGFATLEEFKIDKDKHFAAIRKIFEELDYFIFTLGLTEYWYHVSDGAALPLCPGVCGGVFDDKKYQFGNLGVSEVLADMEEFYELLKSINLKAKIILTVSPVPLAATAENKHVLVSTTYSKSVLRVASEIFADKYSDVAYFPSYEIITGNYNRGSYYCDNLRDVLEHGVEHVMRLFLKHGTDLAVSDAAIETKIANSNNGAKAVEANFFEKMHDVINVICEEGLIEASFEDKINS